MFKPNLYCVIHLSSGASDAYGQPLPSKKVKERCSIIEMNINVEKTSVRADSSASRGSGLEKTVKAVILLESTTKAKLNDVIEIQGNMLRIIGMEPKTSLQGKTDHYRIQAHFWSSV